jgi:hypothetical protein
MPIVVRNHSARTLQVEGRSDGRKNTR